MNKSFAEKVLKSIANVGLCAGIIFGFLYSKGIWESGAEMCVPSAALTFCAAVGCSVVGWAVLMTVVKIAERAANIEERMANIEKLLREKENR